ncbi:MAG: thiamine pyrophosphate-binding protein [Proteobacteria bacterium]|nr:thiamine pyrophosphate-binding protein [Pseudomonadota bacterium]
MTPAEVTAQREGQPFFPHPLPPPLAGEGRGEGVRVSAAQLLVRHLEGEGVGCIFGIPGGPLMPFYEALFDRGTIRPILAKNEQGASFMADGYARVSGRLGVCCTTTGPGATNALTGIACAYRDSVPVLVVSAQIATAAFGKGAAQESSPFGVDIVDIYKSVTKSSLMLVSPERMGDTIRHLLRAALTGRPAPIHLNFPADMMKRPVACDVRPSERFRAISEPFDRASVREAASHLHRARRPAILAGYGTHIARAHAELLAFAEAYGIPVATTPRAKGTFPEDHPLSLGAFGIAGSPQADAAILSPDTDLLLVLGTSLGETSTHAWDARLAQGRTLLQVDVDPMAIGRNFPITCGLVGDVRRVLLELGFELERESERAGSRPDVEAREIAVRELKRHTRRCVNEGAMDDTSVPMMPQRVIAELQRALPEDGILFVDIGNVMAWAIHYFTARRPGTFFLNMGFGSMGHGVAAAIGGQLAAPDRPVVSLVGDSAFLMNGMEVHTAVENDIPVVWIVLNNGGHGMVHLGETVQFKGKFSTALFRRPVDVAFAAQSLGAQAYLATRPGDVERALREALASRRPTVIDARVSIDAFPPAAVRLETLEKFFNKPD